MSQYQVQEQNQRDLVNKLLDISEEDVNFFNLENKPSFSHIFHEQVQPKQLTKFQRPFIQKSQNASLHSTIQHESNRDLSCSPKKRNSRSLQTHKPRKRNNETQTLELNQSVYVKPTYAQENSSQLLDSSKKFLPLQNNSRLRLLISQQKNRLMNQSNYTDKNYRLGLYKTLTNSDLKHQNKERIAQYAHTQDLLIIQKLKTFKVQKKPQSLTKLIKITSSSPVKLLKNTLIQGINSKYYEEKNNPFDQNIYKKIYTVENIGHQRSESQNIYKIQDTNINSRFKYNFETIF